MNTYDGGCHCGNLRVSFTTTLTPAQMEPRSCQCSFCIKHATVSYTHLTLPTTPYV